MNNKLYQLTTRNSLGFLLALTLTIAVFSIFAISPIAHCPLGRILRVIPETVTRGVGENFTVAVVVENMTNLYALEVMFGWDTTYLEYVTHTVTMPQDDYPDPIPPSSYNGTLYEGPEGGIMVIKDVVDESGVSGAPSGTLYWLSVSQMGVCPEFFGNGTLFVMDFKVKKQPYLVDVNATLHFVSIDLADSHIPPTHLTYTSKDGVVQLKGLPQPETPTLKVTPAYYEQIEQTPQMFDVNVTLNDLFSYWDVQGFDTRLSFDPTYLTAESINIDPDGWFASFWNSTLTMREVIDNTEGEVWVAFMGISDVGGSHTPPNGTGCLFTVRFNGTTLGGGGGSTLTLISTDIAGFPHPERPESPWNNVIYPVPIPHEVSNGFYTYIEIKYHDVLGCTVTTVSNSSVSAIELVPEFRVIEFNITGKPEGYTSFCNITIPKELAPLGGSWLVHVNGQKVPSQKLESEDSTYIYFNYILNADNVMILGTNIIPEFSATFALIIFMVATLCVVILVKTKLTKRKQNSLLSIK